VEVYLEHIVVLFGQSAGPMDIEVVEVYLEHIVVLFGQSAGPMDRGLLLLLHHL
jgi:putative transposon-encoded protein